MEFCIRCACAAACYSCKEIVLQAGGYKMPFLLTGGAVLVLAIPSTLLVWRISKLIANLGFITRQNVVILRGAFTSNSEANHYVGKLRSL